MHTYIHKLVSNYLLDYNYSPQEILSKYEVPDEDTTYFARIFWAYGNALFSSNNVTSVNDNLILEVFEKKYLSNTIIEEVVTDIRKKLLYKRISYNNAYAKVNSISISENFNDDNWKAYSIILNFNIFEGGEE